MTRLASVVLSFSLIALAGAAAAAGETRQQDAGKQQGSMQQQAGAMSAQRLIGTDVVDAQGKDMGEIKELVLDLNNGRVHAAVVEFGGFLGIGDKQYAFPVSELKPAKERDKLTLNVNKDQLENERGFDKDKWPAMSDDYWGRMGGKAGTGATRAQGQKANLVRASKLIGEEVQNRDGQQVGEIRDIVLSADRGSIQHIVVDRNDGGDARIAPKQLSLGSGDKLVVDMPAGKSKQGSAAGGASAGERTFAEIDQDNNGMISRGEWEAGMGAGAGKMNK